jgi:ribosomal protein S18 acetylase RimI-like enzyme
MQITPFRTDYIDDAARLFISNFKKLRQTVPATPGNLEDPAQVAPLIKGIMESSGGVAALEHGKLIGYLGWWAIDHFRGTNRRAALVPEWAHATVQLGMEESRPSIYRALYRAAAAHWVDAGCQTHAVTLLASDKIAERTWFWSGFGLTVIDAVRPVQPLQVPAPSTLMIRKATLDDSHLLAQIEAEHWMHYSQPPTLMIPSAPDGPEEFAALLSAPNNSAWLALDDGQPAGYMRFETGGHGAAQIVQAEDAFAITGAYTRPTYRGHGVAPALLDSALRDYAARGYNCCTVDFESLNPEAAAFWMKYFDPVCLSVIRIPEKYIAD